jgi:hypothetical protein
MPANKKQQNNFRMIDPEFSGAGSLISTACATAWTQLDPDAEDRRRPPDVTFG